MKKFSVKFNIFTILAIVSLLLNATATTVRAETEVKKVAVFSFEVMAKEDSSFVGKGMGTMLCSRIAADNRIEVRCLNNLPSEYGLDLGASSILEKTASIADLRGVDFILTGTITIAGESVSTDARLIEVIRPEKAKFISATGAGMGDIMNHATAIAEKVRSIIINGQDQAGGVEIKSGNAQVNQTVINAVGNKVVKNGSSVFLDPVGGVLKNKPLALSSRADKEISQKGVIMTPSESPVLLSRKIDMEIRGIATADIDGDNRLDFIVIDDHTLTFFIFSNNTLVKKGEYKSEYYNRNISLNTIDINKDGKSELFITSIGKNNYLKSYVLEWDGREFKALVKDADWYFNVVNIDNKARLVGQKRGHDEVFAGAIYSLDLKDSTVIKQEQIDSGNCEIFGFSPFRSLSNSTMNENTRYFAWFDRAGFLNLGDDRGAREWKSPQSLGSTPLFIEMDRGRDQLKERIYINSRVAVADINKDGVDEIVTVNNSDVAKGYLAGYRKFTQGKIQIMAWKDAAMSDLWVGNSASGYISDFNVMDMDGDNYPEIIYSVVAETGLVMNKIHSTVFIQKIVAH